MADDGLRYEVLVERALRGVLREALSYIAEHSLPGDHHFYITFRTDHPEVDIPDVLHDRYPGEMTIVLQHQFWDLDVEENLFGVTLSFADVPHRLSIPFEAVVAFTDPSVHFGLQFDTGPGEEEAAEARPSAEIQTLPVGRDGVEANVAAAPRAGKATVKMTGKKRPKTAPKTAKAGDEAQATMGPDTGEDGAGEESAEKVVTLDRFRKK